MLNYIQGSIHNYVKSSCRKQTSEKTIQNNSINNNINNIIT